MIRRIAFVLGFLPAVLIGFALWIITGRGGFEFVNRFDRWAND